jgi:hypothetical protein
MLKLTVLGEMPRLPALGRTKMSEPQISRIFTDEDSRIRMDVIIVMNENLTKAPNV